MTPYEKGRITVWDKTGLLDRCNTMEEKLNEALRWESIVKGIIDSTWRL